MAWLRRGWGALLESQACLEGFWVWWVASGRCGGGSNALDVMMVCAIAASGGRARSCSVMFNMPMASTAVCMYTSIVWLAGGVWVWIHCRR